MISVHRSVEEGLCHPVLILRFTFFFFLLIFFFSLSKSMKTQTSPALSVAVPHDPMDRSKSEFVKGANAWIPRRCGVENTPPYQISVEFLCLGYDDSQES